MMIGMTARRADREKPVRRPVAHEAGPNDPGPTARHLARRALALLWLGCCLPAAGAETPDAPPGLLHPCQLPTSEDEPLVDETQALLEETGCRAALWLDGLFGGEAQIRSAQRTSGYVESSVSYTQFDGFDTRTRLRVRFDLPNLKERVSAFFGRDDEDDFIRDRTEAFGLRSQFPTLADRDEWLAGLGYGLPSSERLQADVKVGAASLREPRAFVRMRLHYNAWSDYQNLVYVRATPFWQTRDGIGLTLGVDYNHVLTPSLLLRVTEVGTISDITRGVDWLSAVILYQNLRDERAIAYQLFARGETDAPEPLFEYGGRTIYRQPLIPAKLYGELVLGYSWPRDDPAVKREGSYEIGFGLELPFGRGTHPAAPAATPPADRSAEPPPDP
ncbi:hypothetical protein C8D93_101501 [Sinimarinibacterium flocculans]|uniref:Uncharacterized protein n=1 Tax=Sinimarinibacterium flocculans TaxID=985250 RepID=A0A318EHP0_9GAMM|nr:hypothetical protein C8D93_101501 [Sinimarinibacterium flocculans]